MQTPAEEILWKSVKNRQLLGYKFRRQHTINKYIADFYCHELKYVIEIDGGYHSDQEQIKYDFNRDGEMKDFGIFVKRIRNEFIMNDFEHAIMELSGDIKKWAGFLL